jgi:hypothetical protein
MMTSHVNKKKPNHCQFIKFENQLKLNQNNILFSHDLVPKAHN